MGTNDRGGSPGFVRLLRNDALETTLVFPEFSGNRLYQTLGNLKTNPLAGLCFPDFDTGDVLYASCTTEVVVGKAAAALLPRSNLAIKAKIIKARFVRQGLAFRGTSGEQSPYNPPIRYLSSEHRQADAQVSNDQVVYAKLLQKDILTPTIARLRFSVTDPEAAGRWDPGQYVALAFEDELSAGYSHMRDDDPKSLNDDYVRTFTVSSAMGQDLPDDEFEITMRNVGVVTGFLFRSQVRAGLELPLKGFGGNFKVSQPPGKIVAFVAGGVGITPLLASLPQLDMDRMRLFWTVNIHDIGLVTDTLRRNPSMHSSTTVFVSGIKDHSDTQSRSHLSELKRSRASLVTRRMAASDIQADSVSKWYVCTGKALRQSILSWLSGKEVTAPSGGKFFLLNNESMSDLTTRADSPLATLTVNFGNGPMSTLRALKNWPHWPTAKRFCTSSSSLKLHTVRVLPEHFLLYVSKQYMLADVISAILILIHLVPTSVAAPVAVPAPTAQPSSSFPNVADRSLPLEAREPAKIKAQEATKAKPKPGTPTDYSHVDLEGMIGDLVIPQEIKTNSSSTATATTTA
ncbi:MAG: hypothetical protein Q9195_000099 [Heterodermia aff. obscurata]